ncbi:MAG: small multi-drug export protein [Thermoplasmatota archaeon]
MRPGLRIRVLLARILETDMERKSARVKVFQFFFPWAVYLLLLALTVGSLFLMEGWDVASRLLDVWIFYSIPVMGKEIIIPKAVIGDNSPPALLVGGVTSIIDICVSLFLIWNYDWVKKIRYLGPKLEETEEKGRDRVRRSRWFSKAAFLATTFFVFVPFKGAGGVGGTILGRILGLKPYRVLLAVFIGSMIESIGYAYLADTMKDVLQDSIVFSWFKSINMIQIFIVIVMLGLLIYVLRNPKKATVRTARFMNDTLELAARGVMKLEELGSSGTELTLMSTADTLENMNIVRDDIIDANLDIATAPISIWGAKGERLALLVKEKGARNIKEARELTKNIVSRGLKFTGKGTERTMKAASEVTVIGLKTAREGVDMGEYVVLVAGDRIEKIIKVPVELMEKGKQSIPIFQNDEKGK